MLFGVYSISWMVLPSGSLIHAGFEWSMPTETGRTATPCAVNFAQ